MKEKDCNISLSKALTQNSETVFQVDLLPTQPAHETPRALVDVLGAVGRPVHLLQGYACQADEEQGIRESMSHNPILESI